MSRSIRLSYALRWLLFITIWWWVTASPGEPLVTLGAPQTVQTRNTKAGVHTRLTDEAAAWKIQHTLQLVREMGAPWIVEFFPWAYIEPGKNSFDWSHADQVIDQARAQGLTVVARLGLVPAWARPDPRDKETTFNYLDADHYDEFGDFVYAFVDRYQGSRTAHHHLE